MQTHKAMTYTIKAVIWAGDSGAELVESSVWHYANGGTWSDVNGKQVLAMGGSGTSGTLRFLGDNGESFIVALGVHNYARWCDIHTDLAENNTGTVLHPEYYKAGTHQTAQREKALADFATTDSVRGRKIEVKYVVAEGNNLTANIIIG